MENKILPVTIKIDTSKKAVKKILIQRQCGFLLKAALIFTAALLLLSVEYTLLFSVLFSRFLAIPPLLSYLIPVYTLCLLCCLVIFFRYQFFRQTITLTFSPNEILIQRKHREKHFYFSSMQKYKITPHGLLFLGVAPSDPYSIFIPKACLSEEEFHEITRLFLPKLAATMSKSSVFS